MASWKKVIVSGSDAELNSVTASLHFFVDTAGVDAELGNVFQTISSNPNDTWLTGSFKGDGSRLTNVTGSKLNIVNDTTSTTPQRILFVEETGFGAKTVFVTSSLTYSRGSDTINANALTATTATTASTATCVTLTGAADAATTHYIPFAVSASGGRPLLTDGQITYNPQSNTLTVTNISGTVSNATNATCIKLTETDDDAAYNLVFATSGSYADARIDNSLTYNASSGLLSTSGSIKAEDGVISGDGGTAGTFSSNGNQDVVLNTGAGTTGEIRIADGANGNISLSPNGSGTVRIGGTTPTIFNTAEATQALRIDGGACGVCVTDAGGLTVECSLNVGGDLVVSGDFTYLNVTNLAVEDRFILLNSGSATGDGGIIVQNSATTTGSAFIFDDDTDRWGFTSSLASNATTVTPNAFAAAVVESDIAYYQKVGNIRIDGDDIYIYSGT